MTAVQERFRVRLLRVAFALLTATGVALAAASAARGDPDGRAPAGVEQVYLTPQEAVAEIFDGVAGVDTVTAVLTGDELHALHEALGAAVPSDTVTVLAPRDDSGARLGYAVVAEEIGKFLPITFMVGTDPDLRVRNVEVLVYRESRGGEVRRKRFLRQYAGKTAEDPIRTNRDVLNVAGATLSVNALNHGVKRVLATLTLLAARNAL